MTIDQLLDGLVYPRPNASEGLERAGAFIAETLGRYSDHVAMQPFCGTPHGFRTIWLSVLALALLYGVALSTRRYRTAFALSLLPTLILMLEFEQMYTPVSGLFGAEQQNIVATFPGAPGAPTVVVGAHYDSTTHLGDHFTTYRWSGALSVASIVAPIAALVGWVRRRGLPAWLRLLVSTGVLLPYGAMAAFYAIGPMLLPASPGAIDNAGSVAVLLRVGERLGVRPPGSGANVELVAFAGEEERAFGSLEFARQLALRSHHDVAMINLESLGAGPRLVYAPDDGWQSRRYATPQWLGERINAAAARIGMPPVEVQVAPPAVLTDARSLLAAGIPAITLRAWADEGFPRGLHSQHDSRDRLSAAALERAADLVLAVIDGFADAPTPFPPASEADLSAD